MTTYLWRNPKYPKFTGGMQLMAKKKVGCDDCGWVGASSGRPGANR